MRKIKVNRFWVAVHTRLQIIIVIRRQFSGHDRRRFRVRAQAQNLGPHIGVSHRKCAVAVLRDCARCPIKPMRSAMLFQRGKPGLVGKLIQPSGAGCLGTGIWPHATLKLCLIHQIRKANARTRRCIGDRRRDALLRRGCGNGTSHEGVFVFMP